MADQDLKDCVALGDKHRIRADELHDLYRCIKCKRVWEGMDIALMKQHERDRLFHQEVKQEGA